MDIKKTYVGAFPLCNDFPFDINDANHTIQGILKRKLFHEKLQTDFYEEEQPTKGVYIRWTFPIAMGKIDSSPDEISSHFLVITIISIIEQGITL